MKPIVRKALAARGVVFIGDSLGAMIGGGRYVKIWSSERAPAGYRKMLDRFTRDRTLRLGVSAAELASGLGLLTLASKGT